MDIKIIGQLVFIFAWCAMFGYVVAFFSAMIALTLFEHLIDYAGNNHKTVKEDEDSDKRNKKEQIVHATISTTHTERESQGKVTGRENTKSDVVELATDINLYKSLNRKDTHDKGNENAASNQ